MNTVVFLGMTIGQIIGYVIALAVVIILIKLFFPKYIKVAPNEALIISGIIRKKYNDEEALRKQGKKKFGYRIVRGGATFYFPSFEKLDKLPLGLITIDIKTSQPVQTKEYASIKVDGVANVKIGSDSVSIANAAEQLLGWNTQQISDAAIQVLEGSLREIVGSMTIAELVQNRDKLVSETCRAALPSMGNMGLEIINLSIQNFEDVDGVIETMLKVGFAEKKRDAAIAEAQAEQMSKKASIEAATLIAEQEKELAIRQAEFKIETDKEQAKADFWGQIAKENERKNFENEKAETELLILQKKTDLEKQRVEIERERLNLEVREKAEADKAARQAAADAEYYEAQKAAEAIFIKGKAEAEALERKAIAMQKYGQAAMLEMVVDKLPEVARAIGEPLSKTEKLIMFGEGAVPGVAKDVSKSMLQTFEALKASVGIDIPKILSTVSKGGLVGKTVGDEGPLKTEKSS